MKNNATSVGALLSVQRHARRSHDLCLSRPAGLSLDDPKGEHPDYAGGRSMFAIWGKPAYIVNAMDVHNQVIRDLAAAHPEAAFIDQHTLLPHTGAIFHDCCHLTPAGCTRFVENMVSVLPRE